MNTTALLVTTYSQMLNALSAWLKQAQGALTAEQAEALLSARLAPDMFPLSTQIRFACLQAHEAVARLTGESLSDTADLLLAEGRNGDAQPGTLADADTRINETLMRLSQLGEHALDVPDTQPVAHTLPDGRVFDLTAAQYVRDWTIPQFYFHLMTAYAILRANAVPLGKADYVAHMFAYLRPDPVLDS